MANSAGTVTTKGGKTNIANFVITGQVSIDTYATGGVDIGALIAAKSEFQAKQLDIEDVIDGFCQTLADTEGIKYACKFDRATRKLILVAWASQAEVPAGSITAVSVNYCLFLQ